MKTLSVKQILITIVISYLITAYIHNNINPFELSIYVKVIQVFVTGTSLLIQLGIKNNT